MVRLRYFVYPYKTGSRSARALADALGGKVLRREGSRFRPRPNRVVINWGSSTCPWESLNPAPLVVVSSNKLSFFRLTKEAGEEAPRVPDWTEDPQEAQGWLEKASVVVRHSLTGHSGRGIQIVPKASTEALPSAPLYVKYIPKDSEYRVHVSRNRENQPEVIDVQRKVRDPNREVRDWQVRNHGNGFVFIRNNRDGVPYRDAVAVDILEQAKRALVVSGLDFGSVDIVWNEKRQKSYVLEINSASGLDGSTTDVYANAIRRRHG